MFDGVSLVERFSEESSFNFFLFLKVSIFFNWDKVVVVLSLHGNSVPLGSDEVDPRGTAHRTRGVRLNSTE